MPHRPTAGQASLEYVAALALVAAVFVVAAPAVGAPDVPKAVVGKLRLAICVVANDVCSAQAAKEAGLAPCPMEVDTKGHEVSVTAFSIEVGHRLTFTVTPRSDGTVSVVWTGDGFAGASDGPATADLSAGPVVFNAGASAGAHARLQVAKGWDFPNMATAQRFVKHALVNTVNESDFLWTWHSFEAGADLAAAAGVSGGVKGYRDRYDLAGVAASGGAALGARVTRDRVVTFYGRLGGDAELTWPLRPTLGTGRQEGVVEYTFDRTGPRELAFRRGDSYDRGNRLTETVYRLDLRDPENLAIARPLIETQLPWPPRLADHLNAVMRRIDTHGTVETTVSEVDDGSVSVSGHAGAGLKFGGALKRINVHRKLVEASARTGGPYERERFDCQPK